MISTPLYILEKERRFVNVIALLLIFGKTSTNVENYYII